MMAPPPDDDEGGDDYGGAEDAVKMFFEAGKSGDYKGAASALRDAITLCESAKDDEESEPEPSDHGVGHALLLMPGGGKK